MKFEKGKEREYMLNDVREKVMELAIARRAAYSAGISYEEADAIIAETAPKLFKEFEDKSGLEMALFLINEAVKRGLGKED